MEDTPLRLIAFASLFALCYFALFLPFAQHISMHGGRRKFTIRMGGAWDVTNAEHRRDVLYSVVSFIGALAMSLLVFDYLVTDLQIL